MKNKHVTDFKSFINENYSNDFIKKIDDEWFINKAENHIESWEERYREKSVSDIQYDLSVNHDISLEIEDAEEELGRELTNDEYDTIVRKFNEAVIKVLTEKEHNMLDDDDDDDD